MHEEIVRAAVARVLDLTDILELVEDGLDERAFAQEQLVGEGHEDVVHVLAELGDQPETLLEEELLSERGRDVAFISEEASKEPADQHRNRTAVVGVARGEAEGE